MRLHFHQLLVRYALACSNETEHQHWHNLDERTSGTSVDSALRALTSFGVLEQDATRKDHSLALFLHRPANILFIAEKDGTCAKRGGRPRTPLRPLEMSSSYLGMMSSGLT
jgi:hypothetical protein